MYVTQSCLHVCDPINMFDYNMPSMAVLVCVELWIHADTVSIKLHKECNMLQIVAETKDT